MSNLDRDTIAKTAALARLALSEEQQTRLMQELGDIFDLCETINRDDIRAKAPLAHPLGEKQRLRADEATKRDMHASIAENAPYAEDGFITVPKVIE
ncbi:Asp-tRNA(Asn)/Glu-tRNA(Gln) amidotransferase subunit GatC [Suttonella sp. R2A3]|uniref:Asp-tRNA(Asn)/Glu-tRNA(Gln) amidotransferase subunit GatC n=1 Tax=Suttonella sp. R2A3 TaxID=2908648 RepID=UPI001F35C868|nr:Asp-tRNA(Asn)/Glu-tRNA(Gln) amidotransferase subunit GatC [Suttonella sp. R2A3]UJF24289.1 Asp-tRNA(Asn)/Glu-tRNA(Gln) amidotransferase subunit GatC [Suttonella sp. R2A3]